jgi:hypothetical protein
MLANQLLLHLPSATDQVFGVRVALLSWPGPSYMFHFALSACPESLNSSPNTIGPQLFARRPGCPRPRRIRIRRRRGDGNRTGAGALRGAEHAELVSIASAPAAMVASSRMSALASNTAMTGTSTRSPPAPPDDRRIRQRSGRSRRCPRVHRRPSRSYINAWR